MAFNDLKVTITKAEGDCTRSKKGASFFVKNAALQIPQGQNLCIFALGSLLPILSSAVIKAEKGEGILEAPHEWQCPNSSAKVLFKIEALE
jgi:uncharacterized repeat protein (TIGR04076 family)